MIAVLAMMVLAAATPKLTTMLPSEYAARCKAVAHVMQESLSVEQYAWRDYQRDWTFWDGRHRDAEGDPVRRQAQDSVWAAQFAGVGVGRNHSDRRALARPIAEQCRRAREAAQ